MFKKASEKTTVVLYKIIDSDDTVIEYFNVINGDFKNLWLLFSSRIGQPQKIETVKNGFICTVRNKKYYVLAV